jgi:hypothetical protein
MPSSTSHITSLTADYDAIERAIRETSRGRWFLSCYLQRNRSAETGMLLGAIAKLESAMRENGQVLEETETDETLATLREALNQARGDMAHLPSADQDTVELPVRRFNFETVPAALRDQVKTIRDAAEGIHSAAYALQAAGVFQGVARQIAERADAIEHACTAQEAMLARAARMASLLSEIESELMSAFEEERDVMFQFGDGGCEIHGFKRAFLKDRAIPDDVVEEISAALSDPPDEGDFFGPSNA